MSMVQPENPDIEEVEEEPESGPGDLFYSYEMPEGRQWEVEKMSKEYDGWILKDKYGDLWYGTFGATEREAKAHLRKCKQWQKRYSFKIIQVKLMEVK